MKKLFFRFPGGAGGHWLGHLCHCLENNDYAQTKIGINFHNQKLSNTIIGDHFTDPYDFLLSTKYKFNLWLNGVCKTDSYAIPHNWYKNVDHYVSQARHHTSPEWEKFYESDIDIDISWTKKDPQKLLDKLFKILDKNQIEYTKNTNQLLGKTKQFVDTCIDPYKYIGNLQDRHWLVWCLGLCKSEDILVSYENEQQVQELIFKNQNYFSEKTEMWSYKI